MKYQYAKGIYGEEEKLAVVRALESGWLSNGMETVNFENEFAQWWGTQYALTVNSGSCANLVALQSLGLQKKSEIITPAGGAFPTTVAPMIYLGLIPVFVDVKGLVIDANEIEKAITPKTKAIMFAHTIGFSPDMEKIMYLAKKYNLKVVEDCCFPAGTKIKTKKGEKNIEDIRKGDLVLTRNGYKKVLKSWMTGHKEVITRMGITATANHPFITKYGVKRFDNLTVSDIIYVWNQNKLCIEELCIGDIQTPLKDKEEFIITDIFGTNYLCHYTDKYGLIPLEKSQKGMSYTIKTIIHSIMTSIISNVSLKKNIVKNILQKKGKLSLEKILNLQEKKQEYGIKVLKVWRSTKNSESYLGRIKKCITKFVQYVVINIKHTTQKVKIL
jgi:hypothetical protein